VAALAIVIFIIVAVAVVTEILVFKMVRGLRVFGIITASRRKSGETTSDPDTIPLLMLTVMVVVEVVRGLRVSAIISASRGQWIKTASEPVTIPLLDGIGGRRRDESH
jgi:hypothetical protein